MHLITVAEQLFLHYIDKAQGKIIQIITLFTYSIEICKFYY